MARSIRIEKDARHYGNTIRRRKPRVAELVGLASGERLAWLAESCSPLPDLGAAASVEAQCEF